jgi:hypothetical protein
VLYSPCDEPNHNKNRAMKKNKTLECFSIQDPAERRMAIESVVRELDEKGIAQGEPLEDMSNIKARYSLSCAVILWCSLIASTFLAISSIYFVTLPRPFSYVSTQDGKLYEIHPLKIEK